MAFEALGSIGRAFEVGRLERGRGRGRGFAELGIVELVAVGVLFTAPPMPNLDGGFKCSREAEGRKRGAFASPPAAVAAPARASLDGDGRRVVVVADLGMGRRDIDRGMPPDLPVGALFSSIVLFWSFSFVF